MSNLKPGPLTGVTVLDFTWVLAGPHAAKTLADMGANVIKVEQYKAGANERWLPKRVEKNGVTQSSYTINVNRGKRSICVNMKSPKGMEIIQKLIKKSDILIENFAPDVMGKLKLDYEKVKVIKPDIIYCSISSFGHWGPYWDRPGYDMIAQGASGWSDQSKPSIIAPMSIGDTVAAIHATTAINAALYHRKVTGQGQNIDISMMDCLFSLHENTLPWYLISTAAGQTGKELDIPKIGGQHPGYAPYGLYDGKRRHHGDRMPHGAPLAAPGEADGQGVRVPAYRSQGEGRLHALLRRQCPLHPRAALEVGHVAPVRGGVREDAR